MAYQEVKRTSYGKNVGNSFRGIFTGLILVIVGTILIFWNENRAIKTYKAIGRAQDACVEMPDINKVSPEFEGKTVHCTGVASTAETVEDPLFGVSENALCLSREVEYYQWVEHAETKTKEKIGGATEETTTYTYEKKWVSSPQASSKFKDPSYQNSNFVYQVIDEEDFTALVDVAKRQIAEGDVRGLLYSSLFGLYAALPPTWRVKNEAEAKRYFLVFMKLIGAKPQPEVPSLLGYADAIVETKKGVYVFEFKFNKSAKAAIRQIREKGYADAYKGGKRPVTLIGINFSAKKRNIDEPLIENL